MSGLEKKKTTDELLASFNENITWENGDKTKLKIGDWIFYRGGFMMITKIEECEYGIYIHYVDESGKEGSSKNTNYYQYIGSTERKDEIEKDSEALLKGQANIQDISQRLENTTESDSRGLMVMNTHVLETKKDHLAMVKSHLKMCSTRAEAKLQSQMSGMYEIIRGFENTIKKIERLIFTIHLYEGMSEDVHHIKIGANASDDEVLTLRQRKLYMDEEVGDPSDDGLDFKNIEDFDDWLLEKNSYWGCYNYEFMVPEQKCVVVLGIRRSDKRYSDNPFVNAMINDNNKWCYLLIRNGENIYRIYSDLRIAERMFPEKTELMKLSNEYEEARFDSDKEKIDEKIDRYKFNMILLQGIIERTDCYPAQKYTLSLFKLNDDSKVKFLYDAESSSMLPSNIMSFAAWKKFKNIGTGVGSQILWFSSSIGYNKETRRMFKEFHWHDEAFPNNPQTGLYQLEHVWHKGYYEDKERDWSFFKYDPNRDPYGWKEPKRVKRVSFLFEEDDNYINYDNITREDLATLEYYFYTRIDRKYYMSVIPVLIDIANRKKAEFAEEDNFIRMALSQAGLNPDTDFKMGSDLMHWWKTKNKWKRTLKTDDAKALRMIVKELKKK